jgi:predicted nucleic acid-binding protein
MIAFDTDVFVELLAGNERYVALADGIPPHEQAVPIVVIEEIVRGRLNSIRRAESGKAGIDVARAYQLFELTITQLRSLMILSYTPAAEAVYEDWRKNKIRVCDARSAHRGDLRGALGDTRVSQSARFRTSAEFGCPVLGVDLCYRPRAN